MGYESKNVLIVDDMKLARLRLKNVCTSMGFKNIFEAANGLEAFKEMDFRKVIPDLILSDYNMPDMNGLQFVEKLRSHSSFMNIPVIFITSESERGVILGAFSAGVTDFIVKPFQDDVVTKKITAIIEGNKQ